MRHYEKAPLIHERVNVARALAPRDIFTRTVLLLQADLYFLTLPFRLIGIPVQLVVKEIVASPVWLLLIPLKAVEWTLLTATTMTAALWTSRPWSRIVVLIPGLLFSRLGYIFTLFTPRPRGSDIRELKLALCDQWPLSWLVLAGSAARETATPGPTVIEGKWRAMDADDSRPGGKPT